MKLPICWNSYKIQRIDRHPFRNRSTTSGMGGSGHRKPWHPEFRTQFSSTSQLFLQTKREGEAPAEPRLSITLPDSKTVRREPHRLTLPLRHGRALHADLV